MVQPISDDEILKKIRYIRESFVISQENLITKYHWTKDDSRLVLYVKGGRLFNALELGILLEQKNLKDPSWYKTNLPNATPETVDPKNIKLLVTEFNTLIRIGLIQNTYGIIESSIRIISNSYNSTEFPDPTIDFSRIFPKFLKLLNLEKYDPLLQIYGILRNSVLHNDGIYYPRGNSDKEIEYDGKKFKFEVGKYVDSSWATILDLTFELGKMTYDIVNSNDISKVIKIEEPGAKFWTKN